MILSLVNGGEIGALSLVDKNGHRVSCWSKDGECGARAVLSLSHWPTAANGGYAGDILAFSLVDEGTRNERVSLSLVDDSRKRYTGYVHDLIGRQGRKQCAWQIHFIG